MATPRKKPEDIKKAGRKSKFSPERLQEVTNYCLLGATNEDLAKYLRVSLATLDNWKVKYPAFLGAIKAGKEDADLEVIKSLNHRARGYSHPDVHISSYEGDITETPITKHYPPDTKAAMFWLTNRQRGKWTDRSEMTGADGSPLVPAGQQINEVELAKQVAFLLRKGVEANKKG